MSIEAPPAIETELDSNTTNVTQSGIHASADASFPHSVTSCVESTGVEREDPGFLEREIVTSAGLLHSSRYRLITALAAYDRCGHWAFSGARTCAHWLAERLGISVGTGREWLRVGHALAGLPLVDAAMADGRLSYCGVRSLTRIAVDHRDHEAELVALAQRTRPGELARALAGWALGHDTDSQREQRERRDTHFSARIEPDGMGSIHVRLPAIDLGRIRAAVDARVMQSHRTDPHNPHPSLGYQRAVALVELLVGTKPGARPSSDDGRKARAGATAGQPDVRVNTEVIVHVRADGCTMHDGTPIADSTVASLIDEGFIRMLIHDAENRPVNASVRRRHPTDRQKRVVDERDPCCVDCGGTELLQYDHQPDYIITRHTHTDELAPRCPHCHQQRHKT